MHQKILLFLMFAFLSLYDNLLICSYPWTGVNAEAKCGWGRKRTLDNARNCTSVYGRQDLIHKNTRTCVQRSNF